MYGKSGSMWIGQDAMSVYISLMYYNVKTSRQLGILQLYAEQPERLPCHAVVRIQNTSTPPQYHQP
jgi:hypothetical protein